MGPGDVFNRRIFAFIIDSIIIGAVSSAIITPIVLMTMPNPTATLSLDEIVKRLGSQLGLQVVVWIATIAYFYLCESYWTGQTVGKKAMRVRVVMADGSALSRDAVLKRSLMRFVDEMLCTFLVGLISAATDRERRRLGDRVAGTLVVDASLRLTDGSWTPTPSPSGEDGAPKPAGSVPVMPGDSNPWGSG